MASETIQPPFLTSMPTMDEPAVSELETETAAEQDPRRPRRVPWVGIVLATVMLTASGAVRAWQSWGVNEALQQGRESPFPLESLPMTLGDWRGEVRELDPEIARATGSTDNVFRSYRNVKTGSRVDLILLYGPTVDVIKHSPMACYPSAGFHYMALPESRIVEVGKDRFEFSTMVFAKGDGDQTIHEEVYFSWGAVHPGVPGVRWAPNMGTWKQIERIPGLYKVHLQRVVSPLERREFGNPCESFLRELMPWLSERYDATTRAPKSSSDSIPPRPQAQPPASPAA